MRIKVLLVAGLVVFSQHVLAQGDGIGGDGHANNIAIEACSGCHEGAGADHQAEYNKYKDKSDFTLTIDDVLSIAKGTTPETYDVTMKFTIEKNGTPYLDGDGLPSLQQKRFYALQYDDTTEKFDNSVAFTSSPVSLGNGQYSVTAIAARFAPETSDAEVYAYIAKGELETEGMTLYTDVANAGKAFGYAGRYESTANVSGCEKCHGTPYMKHGYRAAKVNGLADFAACKTCHYDSRKGGHQDWQVLVDNPERYVSIHDKTSPLTNEEKQAYAYTANVMNDVHMSHAMEFPYPQSMANCATCHEGKLDKVLVEKNFTATTCKSCHPVNAIGKDSEGNPAEGITSPKKAPALKTIMSRASAHKKFDFTKLEEVDCTKCHRDSGSRSFSKIAHTGYAKDIYADANGTKYSKVVNVTIDSAFLSNNILTVGFSAVSSDENLVASTVFDSADKFVPTALVGLYGYNTKDFIVGPHGRDADKKRYLEQSVALPDAGHPRITTTKAENGTWEFTADLTMWKDMIDAGTVRRLEIGIMPGLMVDGKKVALNAPSRTFDLMANAFDDGFYPDIVKVSEGCDSCHDALATTFHSGDRGGNIVVCRMCHTPESGGSHLEMQSRSIDSYVHAIHSFQPFDPGDVNMKDPVAKMQYELHQEHVYPNFTIKNCESCHTAGSFEVPEQDKSLPGVLSASDLVEGRSIKNIPSYVSGPASRACGSCHRSKMIKEDKASELRAFNEKMKRNGYMVKNEGTGVWAGIVSAVMSFF